jgi:DNA-binding response OmpR family regulator
MTTRTPVIAVLDCDGDLLDTLRELLAEDGYRVVTTLVRDDHGSLERTRRFLATHAPDVIIYDLSSSETPRLAFFERLRADEAVAGRPILLLSTHGECLKGYDDAPGVVETMRLPTDIDALLAAVRRAARRA